MTVSSTMSCYKTNSSVAHNGSNSVSDESPMCVVFSLHLVVVADRSGYTNLNGHTDLPGNWMADLPGDLARVLDWPLLALPLGVGVALGSSGVAMMDSVSIAGVGLPLAVTVSSVATRVHLGVVADHTRAVVDLLGHLVALLSHDILAVLDISGVHDGVILGVARLVVLGVAGGVNFGVVFSVAAADNIYHQKYCFQIRTKKVNTLCCGFHRSSHYEPQPGCWWDIQGPHRQEKKMQRGERGTASFSENFFPPDK